MKDSRDMENPDDEGTDFGDRFNLKCRYCFKNLSSRQNLREHTYIHTGLRPYVCDEPGCGKSFRQGSLFSIHKKTHRTGMQHRDFQDVGVTSKISLRLTELLRPQASSFHIPIQFSERKKIISSLGLSGFEFVKGYLPRGR